jgi:hypothetical protein
VIPIPVETSDVLAVLNLPKEMVDNVIFKEHKGLVMETIRSLVLDIFYQDAIRNDYPDDDPLLISFRRHTLNPLQAKSPGNPFLGSVS